MAKLTNNGVDLSDLSWPGEKTGIIWQFHPSLAYGSHCSMQTFRAPQARTKDTAQRFTPARRASPGRARSGDGSSWCAGGKMETNRQGNTVRLSHF